MNVNQRQQTILKVFCAYLVACTLFPPFYYSPGNGVAMGLGYSFLLSPPEDGRMDVVQLLFQWIPAVIISGIAIFLSGPLQTKLTPTVPPKQDIPLTQMETIWSQIHKLHFENETRQLEVADIEKRVANTEKATVIWKEIVSKHFRMITDQEDLL